MLPTRILTLIISLYLICFVSIYANSGFNIVQNIDRHGEKDEREGYELIWTNITVRSKVDNKKVIVDVGSGVIPSGRLVGVLGPSGSGKSTLLRVIGKRLSKSLQQTGDVTINDNTNHKKRDLTDHEIAFVHQDDAFFGMLTVRETLELALKLRQNAITFDKKDDTHADIDPIDNEKLVHNVLSVMGLAKVADNFIGTSLDGSRSTTNSITTLSGIKGFFGRQPRVSKHPSNMHGISGGERKRLAVATELLGQPRLLIADEPTSGLDSFQALQVIQLLHNLTRNTQQYATTTTTTTSNKGMICICSIHQPRTKIWELFDEIILVSPLHGQLVYSGPRKDIIQYFSALNYSCPEHTNPAEFLIDLVSIDATSPRAINLSMKRIKGLVQAFKKYQIQQQYYNKNQNIDHNDDLTETVYNNVSSIDSNNSISSSSSISGSDLIYNSNHDEDHSDDNNNGDDSSSSSSSHRFSSSKSLDHKSITKNPFIGFTRQFQGLSQTVHRSFTRCWLLFQRALKQTLRDSRVNIVRVLTSIILANIIAAVYGKQGYRHTKGSTSIPHKIGSSHHLSNPYLHHHQYEEINTKDLIPTNTVSSRVNIIAQAAINVAMLSMLKTLQLLKREKLVIDRERAQDQYTAMEYLIAKVAAELPFDALVSAVFGWVVQRRSELSSSSTQVIQVLSLLGMVSSSLGLAVGALSPSADVALSIGPALMVVYVIMGAIGPAGIGENSEGEGLPTPLKVLRYLSPMKYACEALCNSEFRGRKFIGRTESIIKMPVIIQKNYEALMKSENTAVQCLVSVVHTLRYTLRTCSQVIQRLLITTVDKLSQVPQLLPGHKETPQIKEALTIPVVSDGDRALKALGIEQSSYHHSIQQLSRMLFSHLFLAFIGLLISKSRE